MDPPSEKNVKHLDNNFFNSILEKILHIIQFQRKWVFMMAGLLLVVGIIGMMNMRTSGKVTDDIHQSNPLQRPEILRPNWAGDAFEISVDTKRKKGSCSFRLSSESNSCRR